MPDPSPTVNNIRDAIGNAHLDYKAIMVLSVLWAIGILLYILNKKRG